MSATCRCCIRNGKHRVYKTAPGEVWPDARWVAIRADGRTVYHGAVWESAIRSVTEYEECK
ncbi:hypothetical protein [Streptomyces sp. bgisy159]|uniref:hypothetical protein n=1 Tax=Streptomyces sp. bgisy159 TaxID=3413795 RepID=UPI003F49EE7A